MVREIFGALYGDIPARFLSDFSLMESVARLRQRTERSVFSSLFHQTAVGPVTESRVRLQRVIPFFGNSFKPIFVGKFAHSHGRIVLEGRFTMFLFTKVFMTCWLVFFLVAAILSTLAAFNAVGEDLARVRDEPIASFSPLVAIMFLVAGVLFVRGCWWLSRNDIVFLTSVIRDALTKTSNSTIEQTR
jgi:hypothetical protein